MSRTIPEPRCSMLDERERESRGRQGLEDLPQTLTPIPPSKGKPLGPSSSS